MNIFEEIKKLNLPEDEFVVLGSGILGALGIREIGDIDLLIKPELFEKLKQRGWKYEVIEIEGKPRDMVSNSFVEAYKDFWWNDKVLSPEDGIAKAEKINGINFIPLRTLLNVKKEMAREKDLRDVVLIEEYLRSY